MQYCMQLASSVWMSQIAVWLQQVQGVTTSCLCLPALVTQLLLNQRFKTSFRNATQQDHWFCTHLRKIRLLRHFSDLLYSITTYQLSCYILFSVWITTCIPLLSTRGKALSFGIVFSSCWQSLYELSLLRYLTSRTMICSTWAECTLQQLSS